MKRIILLGCLSLITFGFVSISYAKTFYLEDGSIIEGQIIKEDEKTISIKDATLKCKSPNEPSQEYLLNASRYFIKKNEIEKIEESKEFSSESSSQHNITEDEAMDEAITIVEKVAKEEPNNPYSWIILGMAHAKKKNFNKAIEYFLKAIEIDGNVFDAHYYLASVYLEVRNKEGAEREYKKTLLLAGEEIRKLEARDKVSQTSKMIERFKEIKEECKLALDDLENSTNHLREKITLGNNDAEARANIQYFTLASEFYKYRKGEYAKSINDLLIYSESPFVINLLNTKEIGGFKYSIEFHTDGYKIIGTPLECGKSGSKIFIGETGEKRTEEKCK